MSKTLKIGIAVGVVALAIILTVVLALFKRESASTDSKPYTVHRNLRVYDDGSVEVNTDRSEYDLGFQFVPDDVGDLGYYYGTFQIKTDYDWLEFRDPYNARVIAELVATGLNEYREQNNITSNYYVDIETWKESKLYPELVYYVAEGDPELTIYVDFNYAKAYIVEGGEL